MAKVTEKDKEIIAEIFKEKIEYLNIYDENLELIDFIKKLKKNQLSFLNDSLKYMSYFGIIYFFINFYSNANSLDRLSSIYYLCELFFIPMLMTYCLLIRLKGSIITFSQLWHRIIISSAVSSVSMLIFGLIYDEVFITCSLVPIIIIPLITLPFKIRWKKKDKLFNDIIENLKTNEKYLETLTERISSTFQNNSQQN